MTQTVNIDSRAADKPQKPHTVQTDNCKRSFLTGVTDVISTADNQILMVTTCGNLEITGSDIRIVKFNADAGELVIEGSFTAWRYNTAGRVKGGIIKRLLK